MRDLEIGIAVGHRFTEVNKALQLQIATDTDGAVLRRGRGGWGDSLVGSWALVAPPAPPTLDPLGNVTGACELAGVQHADQIVALGQRDVRWAKYSQDVKAGEAALFNVFGSRVYLGQTIVALNGGGAFLTFDLANQKVGLSGYPASAGAGAPYLSVDTTSIGLVSATGGSSLTVKDDQVTATGGAASLDFGSVALGKGAADPVVTVSTLQAVLSTIVAWMAAHVHAGVTTGTGVSGVSASVPLTATGSSRVKAAV